MFREKTTEEILKMFDEAEKEIKKYMTENENNKSLNDLRQKLINNLYDKKVYDTTDVELIRILFENTLI